MQKFRQEFYGYNRNDVKQFIDNVIVETKQIVDRCANQDKEIVELKEIIRKYKDIEYNLKISLIKAEKESNEIRNKALVEKKEIIERAKHDASIIVNDALIKSKKIENNVNNIRQNLREIVYKEIDDITDNINL